MNFSHVWVCSADKTKLLFISTNAMRLEKLFDQNIRINVDEEIVEESDSEKLLEVIINNL